MWIYFGMIWQSIKDVVTGYSDFEGYKIYKSKDGGSTWGNAEDMIYDVDGVFAGWRPYQQFDLSREKDSLHCVYSNDYDCPKELDVAMLLMVRIPISLGLTLEMIQVLILLNFRSQSGLKLMASPTNINTEMR